MTKRSRSDASGNPARIPDLPEWHRPENLPGKSWYRLSSMLDLRMPSCTSWLSTEPS